MKIVPNIRFFKQSLALAFSICILQCAPLVHAICTSNGSTVSWTVPGNWTGTCTGGPNGTENVVVLSGTTVNFPAGTVTAASLVLNDGVALVGNVSPTTLVATGGITFQGSSASIQLNGISVATGPSGPLLIGHNIEINNSTLRNFNTSATSSVVNNNVTVTFDGTASFQNENNAKLKFNSGAQLIASAVTAGSKVFKNRSSANNGLDIQGAVSATVEFENEGEIVFPNAVSVLTVGNGTNFTMTTASSVLTGLGKLAATNNDITIGAGKVNGTMTIQVATGKKVINSGAIFSPALAVGALGTINIIGMYSQVGSGKYLVDIDASGSDQIAATEGIAITNADIYYRQGSGTEILNSSGGKTIASTTTGTASIGATIYLQNVFTSAPAITPIAIRTTTPTATSIVATREGSRFVVTSLGDNSTPGSGTLREGLTSLNAQAPGCVNTPYRIRFSVSGTISVLSDLPALGACETGINAHQNDLTDNNFNQNTSINDDDSNATFNVQINNGGSASAGFVITGSGGVRIAGLNISGFPTGIRIGSAGNTSVSAAIHDNLISGGVNGIEIIDGGPINIGGAWAVNASTLAQNRNVIFANTGAQILVNRSIANANQLTIEGNVIGAGPAGSPASSSGIGISVNDVNANAITQNVIASSGQGIFLSANSNATLLNATPYNRIFGTGTAIARAAAISTPIFTYTYLDGSQADGKLAGTTGDTHVICVCENTPGQQQCRKVRVCVPVTIDASGFGPFSATFAPALAPNTTLTAYAVSTGGSNTVKGTSQLSAAASLPSYTVTPPSTYTYPNTLVGQQTSQTFTIQNSGSTPTQIDGSVAGLTISNSTAFVIPPASGTCQTSPILLPSQSCTVVVNFTPTSVTPFLGYLNISSVGFSGISITLDGTGIQPGIAVTPTGSLSFPSTTVGATSASQLVQIDNSGTAPLTVSSISVTSGFSLVAAPGATCAAPPFNLATSTNCSIAVAFNPIVGGSANGQLLIASNAGATVIKSLTGFGIVPNTLSATITFLPANAIVGQVIQLPVNISNTGTSAAAAVSFSYSLPTGLIFTAAPVTSSCGGSLSTSGNVLTFANGTIAAGANCIIEASIVATTAGVFAVSLPAASSTVGGLISPAAAAVSVASGALIATVPANGAVLAFGTVTPATASSPLTVKVSNDGNLPSSLSVSVIGTNAAQYSFTGCGTSLSAASSCVISITCTPSAAAVMNATLQVVHSGANPPATLQYPLTCTGGTPLPISYSLSPTSTTFSSTLIGSTSTATFTLTNANRPLTISRMSVTGAGLSIVNGAGSGSCPQTGAVGAGGVCTIVVAYKPSLAGSVTGQLEIFSDAINTPASVTNPSVATIFASAPTAILINPNQPYSFGSVNLGVSSAPQSRTLVNNTTVPMSFTAFTIPAGYIVSDTCVANSPLAPSASCVVTVTFKPTTGGVQNVSLSSNVTSTAIPGGLLFSLLANGTGVSPFSPTLVVTPTTLSFTNQVVNQTSAPQSIRLSNTGTGDLFITAFTPPVNSGIARASATAGDTCTAAAIAPNASCVAFFTYTPSVIENVSGAITITSNAPTQTVAYSASSIAAPAAKLEVDVTVLDFLGQVINTQSLVKVITVRNTGTAAMTVSITSSGSAFTVSHNCPALGATQQIIVGRSCEVNVSFKPTAEGNFTGAVAITHNASNTPSPLTVPLKGLGLPEPIAGLSFTPSLLDFGTQTIGTATATPRTVVVRSTGTAAAKITSITNTGDFSFSSNCPLSPTDVLLPTFECAIVVTFKPQTLASQTGFITVSSNAPLTIANGIASNQITLKGTASPLPVPNIEASTRRLNFATLIVGSVSEPQSVLITNTGFANLRFDGLSIIGNGFALSGIRSRDIPVDVPPCGTTLAPGDKGCWISVVFAPTQVGDAVGELAISSNVAGGALIVSLFGSGAALPKPLIAVSFESLNFGEVIVGTTSASQQLRISNRGDAPLSLASINANSGDFALQVSANGSCSLANSVIAVGASCTVDVVFSSQTLGAKSATLNIVSNSGNADSVNSVRLTGTTIPAPAPLVRTSVTVLGFGNTVFGGATPSQSVVFSNNGTAPLLIGNITATGDFSQNNNCPATLAVGANCTVAVIFSPVGLGSRGGELQLRTNAVPALTTVSLGGTGCRLFSVPGSRTISSLCAQ
jgi:uncharacterized repeat protein (TIGR01451 family)